MDIVKYTVETNKDYNTLIIRTFVNDKLDKEDKISDECIQKCKQDCIKLGMTFDEGVKFLQDKLNKIAKMQNEEFEHLDRLAKLYPDDY